MGLGFMFELRHSVDLYRKMFRLFSSNSYAPLPLPLPLSLFFLTALLYLFGFPLLASQPQRPKGVHTRALYHSKGSVWLLDQVGKRTVWFKKGILKAKGDYDSKARKRAGQWLFYHPNGKKKAEGSYSRGKKEGLWRFFDSSNMLGKEGSYKRGLQDGEWKFYHPNTSLRAKGHYKMGQKEGEWKGYYKNAKVFYIGHFRKGKAHGKWEYRYKGGAFFQKGSFRRDVRIGIWDICVYPKGPCSKEYYNPDATPAITKLNKKGRFRSP